MSVTVESAVLVLNAQSPFVQAAEFEGPEVDVPDPVVDLLQTHVLADTHDRDVHPAAVPAKAALGTDVAGLESVGGLQRRGARGRPAGRGVGGRGAGPRA